MKIFIDVILLFADKVNSALYLTMGPLINFSSQPNTHPSTFEFSPIKWYTENNALSPLLT